jgi:hypothetical protein
VEVDADKGIVKVVKIKYDWCFAPVILSALARE